MTRAIIFDLGAVLIDWNPRHLYKRMFKQDSEIDYFLENICTAAWNEEQDAGRTLKEATDMLVERFPAEAEYIRAYYGRWEEMLAGPIEGTVEIFRELKESGRFKIYALTNWSSETFPIAQQRFGFLNWFDGIVVSGEEKMRKPFPEFYQVLLDRYGVNSSEALFIDDNLRNVEAAINIGIDSIHYQSPEQLRAGLQKRLLI